MVCFGLVELAEQLQLPILAHCQPHILLTILYSVVLKSDTGNTEAENKIAKILQTSWRELVVVYNKPFEDTYMP